MAQEKEYFAFISYQRKDEEWADKLRNKLEHYRLPSSVRKQDASLPKEIRPIFRDALELAGGVLAKEIETALQQSKYLIVICSPNSAKSPWVNKEIQTFIDLGREDHIIPFIIDGTPFSDNEDTECFPPALRSLKGEKELLGININELSRDAACIKVVACMFGLKFDTLWQRHERERRKKRNKVIAGISVLALLAVVVAGWIWRQNKQVNEKEWQRLEEQSKVVAKEAISLVDNGDSYTAQRILMEVLPKDLNHPDRPFVPETESALRYALMNNTAVIKRNNYAYHSVSFSPDGHRLASTSADGDVIIWNADDGRQLWKAKEQYGETYSVSFSPNGRYLMVETFMYGEYTTWIWDSTDGTLLQRLDVSKPCFSPDSKCIISVSNDRAVVWDIESGTALKTFDEVVYSVCYSPDGKQVVSETPNNTFVIWDAETGRVLRKFDGYNDIINCIVFSHDGSLVGNASRDGTIKIWSVNTGRLLQTLNDDNNDICSVNFSPNDQHIVSASGNGNVKIWNVKTGTLLQTLIGHTDYVSSVQYSPDGHRIASCSSDGTIRLWDLGVADSQPMTMDSPTLLFKDVSDTSNENILMAADSIIMWNVGNECKLLSVGNQDVNISTITQSPDGKEFVTASWDTIKIWDANTGKLIRMLNGHTDNVNSVAYNSKGDLIVSTSTQWDGTIRIWNANTGEQIHHLNDNGIEANFACFSPDDKYIVSASSDNTLELWSVETGQKTLSFQGHTGFVNYVNFSHDGRYIVSASDDGTVRVWNTQTGDLVQTFKGYEYTVKYAAFSSDERSIITISSDKSIRIWSFPPFQQLMDEARNRFKDSPLTPEERQKYHLD